MLSRSEPHLLWVVWFLLPLLFLVAGTKCSVPHRDIARVIGYVFLHGVSSLFEFINLGRLNIFRQLMFAGLAVALIFSPEIVSKHCRQSPPPRIEMSAACKLGRRTSYTLRPCLNEG